MTREEAIEFIAQSVKSDVDMAKVADAIKALKQEPIKNHLGVDCVSREQALVAIRNLYPGMPRVDFNGSLRKWVDKYKPYIECEDAINELSPVTPIRPKGHWIETAEEYYKAINEKGGGVNESTDYFTNDIACSECLAKFSVIENEADRFDFCPCCGSDNR